MCECVSTSTMFKIKTHKKPLRNASTDGGWWKGRTLSTYSFAEQMKFTAMQVNSCQIIFYFDDRIWRLQLELIWMDRYICSIRLRGILCWIRKIQTGIHFKSIELIHLQQKKLIILCDFAELHNWQFFFWNQIIHGNELNNSIYP